MVGGHDTMAVMNVHDTTAAEDRHAGHPADDSVVMGTWCLRLLPFRRRLCGAESRSSSCTCIQSRGPTDLSLTDSKVHQEFFYHSGPISVPLAFAPHPHTLSSSAISNPPLRLRPRALRSLRYPAHLASCNLRRSPSPSKIRSSLARACWQVWRLLRE